MQEWRSLSDRYWELLPDRKELRNLEKWFQEEFPTAVKTRGCVIKEELVKLVKWKVGNRGKFRPRLLAYANEADESAVIAASKKAYAALGIKDVPSIESVKKALEAMTVIKGVGPATASGILQAMSSSCPFMSDESLEIALGSRDYTVKKYIELMNVLRHKAEWLTEVEGVQWTAAAVERCIFVHVASKDGTKKRKR